MSADGAIKREVFEASKPDEIERLARIEGESNFISLLAGVEAGKDTTTDMAALSFARRRGCVPEVLECYAAQSGVFKLPLMSMTFEAICIDLKPKAKDLDWMRGAVADAFLLLRYGHCKSLAWRARHFRVDHDVYAAIRKLAHGILRTLLADAERYWKVARFSRGRISTNRHHPNVEGRTTGERASIGSYRANPLPTSDQDFDGERFTAIPPGVRDRAFFDEREAPAPVTELSGTAYGERLGALPMNEAARAEP